LHIDHALSILGLHSIFKYGEDDMSEAVEPMNSQERFSLIAQLDWRIEEQRHLNDLSERELFISGAEAERRKSILATIALRDELIEELLARRALLAANY
jgi:hypothetical protein